ncbi:unnamed protein product, partial [Sphacelaria rigidula]
MYKRMADAGYLSKVPGMGAADIIKTHERFQNFQRENVKRHASTVTGASALVTTAAGLNTNVR